MSEEQEFRCVVCIHDEDGGRRLIDATWLRWLDAFVLCELRSSKRYCTWRTWACLEFQHCNSSRTKFYEFTSISPSCSFVYTVTNHLRREEKAEVRPLVASQTPILIPIGMSQLTHSTAWRSPMNCFGVFTHMVSRNLLPFSREPLSRQCWERIWLHKPSQER